MGYASDMQTFLHLFCIWTVVAWQKKQLSESIVKLSPLNRPSLKDLAQELPLNVISRAEHHNIFVWSDSQLSDGAFLAYLSVFASHFNIASVIEFVQLFMISYLFWECKIQLSVFFVLLFWSLLIHKMWWSFKTGTYEMDSIVGIDFSVVQVMECSPE